MRVLALLGALIVACTSQPAQSAATQSARASASPNSYSCRLAVISWPSPTAPLAGYLTLPGGTFTVAGDAGSGMYYDRPLNRWVRGGPPALSADGLSYAYSEGDTSSSRLHLLDLRSGGDQVVASGGPWQPVGLDADWVYAMRVEYQDSVAYGQLQIGRGLWKAPVGGGAPVQLTSDARYWAWVANGGAYGAGIMSDVAGAPNDVVRMDLRTLQTTTSLDKHARSRILAVDPHGAAFVMTDGADEELWRVTQSGNAMQVWSGSTSGIRPEQPVALAGSEVWFSSSSLSQAWAIYHYSPLAGLQQVATFTDRPVTVAGPCVV